MRSISSKILLILRMYVHFLPIVSIVEDLVQIWICSWYIETARIGQMSKFKPVVHIQINSLQNIKNYTIKLKYNWNFWLILKKF